jgi:hypothetical protein
MHIPIRSRAWIVSSFIRQLRYFLLMIVLGSAILFFPSKNRSADNPEAAFAASDPVIAAAGDIACDPANASFNAGNGTSGSCRQQYTSDLLVNANLAAVLPLGDIQYYCGGYQAFLQSYDLSWGRVKSISRPVVGNHEYITTPDPLAPSTGCDITNDGAAGYFNYFGAAAGNAGQGYYSYDIGNWHLIALNSNCDDAGGCSPNSPQGQWLQADLAAHPNFCTLAYWHIPLFSSSTRHELNSRDLWQILYDHNADLILNGHEHIYERFAPQAPDGTRDVARGLREFIVGTGGANHTAVDTLAANSEVRHTGTYGILKLTLHPTSYDWEFVPEIGKTFTDAGTGACHGDVPDTTPPGAPSNLAASFVAGNEVHLNWTPAADNIAVVGYQVFRDGVQIGFASGTSYVDTTTQAQTTYDYSVVAVDGVELTSAPSNTATVTPFGLFNDGFESGNTAGWTFATNLVAQPQEVFSGSYAVRGTSNGLPTHAYKQLTAAQNELYYRIQFKIISQTQTMNLLKFRTANGLSLFAVFVSNTGILGSRNDVMGVSTFSTTPVSKGVWHELEAHISINGSASQAEVWLDGNPVAALSKAEAFGTNPVGRIQLGENATGLQFDVVYDDVSADTQFIPFRTIATQTPTATSMPTPTFTPIPSGSIVFSDGFETGNLSQWTMNQGLAVQTQPIASGTYAARGTSAAGGATYARKLLAAPQTDLYYRIWFHVLDQAANTVNLMKFRTATNAPILSVSVNNLGKLSYRNDIAGTSVNSTVNVVRGQWHSLQVHVRIAGTASQVEVWYNGVLVNTLSRTESLGTNPIGTLQLGENTPGLIYDLAFDDVAASLNFISGDGSTPNYTPTPAATNTPTRTPTSTATTQTVLTFMPVADTYVQSDMPTTNYGSSSWFVVDNSPVRNALLKFTVSGVGNRSVSRVRLRLYCVEGSPLGGEFQRVPEASWNEGSVIWNTAPTAEAPILASLGSVSAGNWYEVDLTSLVNGDGTFSLKMTSPNMDGAYYSSREGANTPQLIVEVAP